MIMLYILILVCLFTASASNIYDIKSDADVKTFLEHVKIGTFNNKLGQEIINVKIIFHPSTSKC